MKEVRLAERQVALDLVPFSCVERQLADGLVFSSQTVADVCRHVECIVDFIAGFEQLEKRNATGLARG